MLINAAIAAGGGHLDGEIGLAIVEMERVGLVVSLAGERAMGGAKFIAVAKPCLPQAEFAARADGAGLAVLSDGENGAIADGPAAGCDAVDIGYCFGQ